MRKILSAITFLSVLFLFSCDARVETSTTKSFNLDSAKAQIASSNEAFGKAWATGDSTSFASRYTSDACINPPNMPRMCGTAAITAFFNGGYAMGVRNVKLTTEEVMGSAEVVAETGTYAMLDSAGNTLENGKFIVLWKEENGVWKMHKDVWNSDAAPGAPVPSK
ncbi:MAG TPA: DUF4440 domain-containing protein [Ferruginibacter sp.]|nr:DUF4440 domain-containing protein [Ferruginibacter sp.]